MWLHNFYYQAYDETLILLGFTTFSGIRLRSGIIICLGRMRSIACTGITVICVRRTLLLARVWRWWVGILHGMGIGFWWCCCLAPFVAGGSRRWRCGRRALRRWTGASFGSLKIVISKNDLLWRIASRTHMRHKTNQHSFTISQPLNVPPRATRPYLPLLSACLRSCVTARNQRRCD